MQRQLLPTRHRALGQAPLRASLPPGLQSRRAARRPFTLPQAAAAAADGPSTSGSGAEPSPAVASPAVVEATEVVEPGQGEEAGSSEEYVFAENPDYPEVPQSTGKAIALQYGGLGVAYAVAGGAVAAAALQSPQLLLAPSAAGPWGAALLACVGATYLRAAGVCLHLANAAVNGELLCWRHQRLALATAASALLAALSQVAGVASVPLAGAQALLAVATVAVVGLSARAVLSVRPFVWAVVERGGGTAGGVVRAVANSAVEAVSTVGGVLLLAAMAVGLSGFVAVVPAAAPAVTQPLGAWPGSPVALDGAAAALRRLVGAGLLLAAAQAHALLDAASSLRRPPEATDTEIVAETILRNTLIERDPLSKYYLPRPDTFTLLHLSFVLAAALTAYVTLQAPGLGVDVNMDGALWGPLYGTWATGLLYGIVALTKFDWTSVSNAVLGVFVWLGALVLTFFNTFVWKFEWANKVKRK
ncbi:hypothetical protein HYH03_010248 [Edaphochlamys debaryana]|uniref:Uncharacterized protein n=1 Tax=Edaphochlamys debaryana TaxID=47281 RepID=A0A835XUL8_9CHLO|nr:hypothetical protein HYH03_010248 [Edaphochlamys debaryana]|eukprot:KAG2491462.1 hypothetical protein HYH03_010248 [Edaphochlamys debaryana]